MTNRMLQPTKDRKKIKQKRNTYRQRPLENGAECCLLGFGGGTHTNGRGGILRIVGGEPRFVVQYKEEHANIQQNEGGDSQTRANIYKRVVGSGWRSQTVKEQKNHGRCPSIERIRALVIDGLEERLLGARGEKKGGGGGGTEGGEPSRGVCVTGSGH